MHIIKNQLEYISRCAIINPLRNIHNKRYFKKSLVNLLCFDASYKCLVTARKGKNQSMFSQVKISASVNVRHMISPVEKNYKQPLEVLIYTFPIIRLLLSLFVAFILPTLQLAQPGNPTEVCFFCILDPVPRRLLNPVLRVDL